MSVVVIALVAVGSLFFMLMAPPLIGFYLALHWDSIKQKINNMRMKIKSRIKKIKGFFTNQKRMEGETR